MATVTKPLALNESLNTTENTPRNIADVLADELDGIKQAINQSGSGNGHIIQNSAGANMPSENTMQFVDAHLSDDSVGGKTKVENIKSVTEAQFESATEDGLYDVDIQGAEIEPASDEYVEVEQVTGGEKTYATLLNELYALIDRNKLTDNSYIIDDDGSTKKKIIINRIGPSIIYGTSFDYAGSANMYITTLDLASSGSYYVEWTITQSNVTNTNKSSTAVTVGTKFTLYYGNKSAVIDLQTTANRCLMSDGNSVEDTVKKISLPVTAASGITLDINDLVQMNGIVFGTLEIEASSNWTTGSWAEIGQISNYSNDKLILAMAWDTSNGNYFGMVRIESNGSVKVYPKISTKYCQVRF